MSPADRDFPRKCTQKLDKMGHLGGFRWGQSLIQDTGTLHKGLQEQLWYLLTVI